MLVVTKSLCGFLSNQVQYNIESPQYLGQRYYIIIIIIIYIYIYIYIYILNSWNLSATPVFHGDFCKTKIIRQLTK